MSICNIEPPKCLGKDIELLNVQMGGYKILYSYKDNKGKIQLFAEDIKDAEKRLKISLKRSKK